MACSYFNVNQSNIYFQKMFKKLFKKLPYRLCQSIKYLRIKISDGINLLFYQYSQVTPPPHIIKFKIILTYQNHYKLRVFIETGTFEGEMVRRCRRHFQKIYSIELDDHLAKKAAERFSNAKNINIIQGNSACKLSEILTAIKEPALFWLDAHYSGGITAKGDSETPIMDELRAIKAHKIKNNVILIDDMRCFGQGDFPAIDEVKKELYSINPRFKITIVNDILRCEPRY